MKKAIRRAALWVVFMGLISQAGAQWGNPNAIKLAEVMDRISRFYVDSTDNVELAEHAIEHMLHELDPHSSYLSREEMERLNENLEGEFEGIGVRFNILEDTIYIVAAIAGGPSERIGIRAGDRIIAVNNEVVAGTGLTNTDVQRLLKGPKGTTVDVRILRRGRPGLIDFSITRDKIPVYSLDAAYMVDERIAYIKLARFSHTSIDEIEQALRLLKREGMKDLILDLSGNGGGWLPVAVELADHFIPGNGEIVRTEGEKVPERLYRARKIGLFEEGRLVVMIDGGSASASEIVSGAVQDWDRGVIVGRRSFGKGLVQQPFKLTDGSVIRLTVARYYTPTGRLIQKPYKDGYKEYTLDLIKRYNRGELNSADSIQFPDSLRYRTLKMKRTVYGGGGIMPDFFVPIDTSAYSDYYRELIGLGLFNRYVLQFVDEHRAELLREYPGFEQFNAGFMTGRAQLDKLIAFADREELPFDQSGWDRSGEQIALLFKAYLARDLYGPGYFFEVLNPSDEVFTQAVNILREPEAYERSLSGSNP